MMNNLKKTLIATAFAAYILPMAAQNMHGNVTVEGTYSPEIIVRERIYTKPRTLTFNMPAGSLKADLEGVQATFAPDFTTLPSAEWEASFLYDRSKGYADLSLGSWLQSNVSAGYRFIDNWDTTLGAMLQFNSTSLYKPWPEERPDARRNLYDGTIGVYGSHEFRVGTLYSHLYYNHSSFNYYGAAGLMPSVNPSQNLDAVDFTAGFKSGYRPWHWKGQFNLGFLGYGKCWMPNSGSSRAYGLADMGSEKETHLSLEGTVSRDISTYSALGIDLKADGVFYSEPAKFTAPGNYGNVALRPHFSHYGENFSARLGIDIEFTCNAKVQEVMDYSVVHLAPDVTLGYRNGLFGATISATGGQQLQTLASLRTLDYYTSPFINGTVPVYTPVNTEARLTFGSFHGISIGAHFGWKIERYRRVGGWYMQCLQNGLDDQAAYSSILWEGMNLHGWSAGADARVEIADIVTLSGDFSYQPQRPESGWFNGYDRPRWIVDASMAVAPMKGLKIDLSYTYRGVRKIWYADLDSGNCMFTRLPDITRLDLGAAYVVTPRITIHGSLCNLLNIREMVLPGQPLGGINFLLGCAVKF